jgi:anti-sigma B factor antagonist
MALFLTVNDEILATPGRLPWRVVEDVMQIEERAAGDVTILDLKGRMTLGEGDELLKDKINSLALQGRKQLVLNLADVPYIDSAGLGEVVRTYTTVKRQGGSLKLLNLTKRITDLLAITKLLTVFETYDNEADAVRSFTTSAGAR